MEFTSIMHVAFFTDRLDEMRAFYTDVMGGTVKIVTRAKAYLGRNRGYFSELAETDPEQIIIMYIELAPGQFIELFPKRPGQGQAAEFNANLGYSHFALTVDDIFAAREELEARGLVFDTQISKGPSETYQMWAHDPDGNKFEIMQFTELSYQVVGHIM